MGNTLAVVNYNIFILKWRKLKSLLKSHPKCSDFWPCLLLTRLRYWDISNRKGWHSEDTKAIRTECTHFVSSCISPVLSGGILKEYVWESNSIVSIHGLSFSCWHRPCKWVEYMKGHYRQLANMSLSQLIPFLIHRSHADHVSLHTFLRKSKFFSLNCKTLYARSPSLLSLFALLVAIPLHPSFHELSHLLCHTSLLHMTVFPIQIFLWKILAMIDLWATSCTTSSCKSLLILHRTLLARNPSSLRMYILLSPSCNSSIWPPFNMEVSW